MLSGFGRWSVVSLFAFLAGSQWLAAQMPVYRPGEYPAPRYPQIKANYTMDELVAMAREVVRRPYQNAFLKAGYNIQPGHRALIVVNGDFDRTVMEALVRAIQEAGGQADVVMTYGQKRDPNYLAIEHAYREANGILG
ncbi:MAG TPA: hypothetical protein VIC04_02730, partial [Terriglobia bacterium]